MTETSESKKKNSLVQRIITGVSLALIIAIMLYVGGWLFCLIVGFCLIRSVYEELHVLRRSGHRPVWWISFAGLTASVPILLHSTKNLTLPLITFFVICTLIEIMRREEPKLEDLYASLLPLITIVLPGMCMFSLLNTEPRGFQAYLLVLMFAIPVANDTFAFFIGSAVGGPKLCIVSPKKTISGAIGGLVVGTLVTVIATWLFSMFVPNFTHFPALWASALFGIVCSVASQLGDLFASLVKRYSGVKDFSEIFPGHGGMLDRLDSILFSAVLVYCLRELIMALM